MFCLSRRRLAKRAVFHTRALACLAAALGLCLAAPAQAQIASYVDSHGRTVYVNADPPAKAARHQDSTVLVMPSAKLQGAVNAAAERNNLDPALVQAVIQTESNWNPYAVSRKGAFGLMQLIPSTAERYGVFDVFDPVQNINGGARYLRDLLDKYHGDLKKSLAAYNAGELAVQRFGGVPQYAETRNYVRKVTTTYFQSSPDGTPDNGVRRRSSIHQITGRTGRAIFTNE